MRGPDDIQAVPDLDQVFQPIGHRADGTPIFQHSGAAAADIDDWIPIEYDSDVVQRVMNDSAIEGNARRVPMRTKTKSIPRSAGITVTVGTTYTDDTSANDEVTITARRFIARFKVDEDDLADAETRMDVIQTKGEDWAISYADTFDNACIGVTAAENGTTAPFTSIYKALRTTDNDVGYTADDNYISWDDDNTVISTSAGQATNSLYGRLSEVFRLVETGKYWSDPDMLVIAHPGWRDALRMTLDGQGRPVFIAGTDGTPDTLFNTPISWSRGCKSSATMVGSPEGNDLLVYANTRYLARGDRSGPETRTDDARAQDDTDDYAVKFRTRRAFKVTHQNAVSILERITD